MPNRVIARIRISFRCLAGLVVLVASDAWSQASPATLRGVVRDADGTPVGNAEVRIVDLARATRTDTTGAFLIGQLPSRMHEVSIRRLGYQLQLLQVTLTGAGGDPIHVRLIAEPMLMPSVDIEATNPFFKEFEARRSRGLGTFITRDQVAVHNSSYPSDAFRSLPGVRVVRVGGGMGIRIAAPTGLRRGTGAGECAPMIWVDGQKAPGMEIDDIRAGDVHGIEIYRGASTTPSQFVTAGVVQCGTIVVWTRRKS